MPQSETAELREQIAIVGMAGRFPGAKNVDELWENLCNGVESVSFFTEEEVQSSGVDPVAFKDPTFVNAGAVMDGADCFDAAFFGVTPREAEIIDPQHRVFLECAWEALEYAGYDSEAYDGAIGVFGGVGPNTYFQQNLTSQPELLETAGSYQAMIGNAAHFPTTRVSYKLNLKGPSINVQTACSTSGVAIHLACQSLLSGESDIALAGGARIKVPLKGGYFYQPDGIPSPDGHCRAFDAQAQGTVYGSGVAIIILKRLSDALHDGDSIYAVIKGSAINNDGSMKVGFTAPSVQGQAAAIAEAYALAEINADSISYIEAHGTGTALGDPIEIAALTRAFRETTDKKQFCSIGSVKTNIGHLDAAAGVTGVIKTALALKHKLIPPSLNFQEPNPQIDFQNSPFYVNTKLSEWKEGNTPRRAGVSSFGLGGTNVHIVLEEPPVAEPSGESTRPWQILALSAKTSAALDAAAKNLAQHLQRHPHVNLADVAYTSSLGRRPFSHRHIAVCRDVADAVHALGSIDPKRVVTQVHEGQSQSVVFMFPGGGAQYVNMGLELYERELIFREQVDKCLELLKPHAPADLKRVLFPAADNLEAAAQLIEQPPVALPLLFTLEWAMAKLLMSWGIQPAAMIGHSLGEYTAACLSGVISLADALALVALRGRLFATLPAGAMLSISAPEEAVRALMGTRLSIAAINKPSSCVVSGEIHVIEEMERRLAEKGIDYGRVHISVAAHSQMVELILGEFGRFVESLELQAPSIPYVSNVTGAWITAAEATDPSYWMKHLRQTVRFSDGLQVLMKEPEGVLLEVGPGQTLSTLARQHPNKAARQAVVSTFRHLQEQTSDVAFLLKAVGRLWLTGVEVDWSAFYRNEQRQRVALPTYPFERKRYWIDSLKAIGGKAVTRDGQETLSSPDREDGANLHGHVTTREEQKLMSSEPSTSGTATPRRQETIISTLKEILEHLSGVAASELDEHATFLEMGFDSLFLTRANVAFEKKFGVKVTFRQLFRECPTLDALAGYIDGKLPPEAVAPEVPRTASLPEPQPVPAVQPPVTAPSSQPLGAETFLPLVSESVSTNALELVISQQLRVMSEQLEVLRNGRLGEVETRPEANGRVSKPAALIALAATPAAPRPDKPEVTNVVPVVVGTELRKMGPQTPANWKPVKRGGRSELTSRQRQYLEALIARYTNRTQGSKRLTQAQRRHMSDPISVSGFNAHWKEMVYQIAIARASGSRFVDVDGNEYVDLTMSFSANLFGHSPSFVTQAVEEQLKQNLGLGTLSPLTRRVADMVCEITGMERATFLTTGSEANMAALRAARLVTGRDKFAVFGGAYHGVFDEVLIKAVRTHGQLRPEPVAPGIPERAVEDVLVLDYGDPQSLTTLQEHGDQLAAVFVEAVQSRHPDLQPRQFLHALREITAQKGIALVFDEVITGFRLHPKGAQGWFDVQADLASYGKLIGGGMPMSALAGKAVYMDAFDGGSWNYGDDSFPEAGVTFFAGTFMKHPLSLAAAAAVLEHVQRSGPRLQDELNQRASQFVKGLNDYFTQQRVAIWIEHCGSMLYFTFPDNNELARLLFYALRDKGVYIWDRPLFLSTAHTDEDLAFITRAVQESVAEMRDAGILEEQSGSSPHGHNGAIVQHDDSSPEFSEPAIVLASRSEAIGLNSEMENRHGNVPREVPTTESQLEIWLASQMGHDASCSFNLCYSIRLRGQLQQKALRQALQQLIDRHDSLRATFSPGGEQMRISPLIIDLPVLDYAGPDQDKKVVELLAGEVQRPFDLVNGPLIRAHLVNLEEQHHILVLSLHHVICDGFSIRRVMRDFTAFYSAECQGDIPRLPKPMQYSEYAQWQLGQQGTPEYAAAEEYWLKRFSEVPPPLELPADRPRKPVTNYSCGELAFTFDRHLVAELKRVGARYGCTLWSMLLSGFTVLLHRLSNQTDIVVGTQAAGQMIVGNEDLVGHCVNLQPFRTQIDSNWAFSEYVKRVQELVLDAYDHRNFTFGTLLKKLKMRRDGGRFPVLSVQFNLEEEKTPPNFYGLDADITFSRRSFYTLDLGVNLSETNGQIDLKCWFSNDLFDSETIQRWMGHFQTLLKGIVTNPEQRIWELPLLEEQERHELLVEWNATQTDYPRDECIHTLFEAQAIHTPDATAVVFGEEQLTYSQLNRQANRLAHYLRARGIGPDVLVGVCLERSLEMIVGLLGILKAGGAYVPLDPTYPQERLALLLRGTQMSMLLTKEGLRERLPTSPVEIVCLDADWDAIACGSDTNPVWSGSANNLAYVMYTSGSTGTPKGVCIPHRGVVRLVKKTNYATLTAEEVFLQFAPFSFDASTFEIWGALLNGARLVVFPPYKPSLEELGQFIDQHQITTLWLTAGLFHQMVESSLASLLHVRQLLAGGDVLSVSHVKKALGELRGGRLINGYGPTECTTFACCYPLADPAQVGQSVLIGRPIANTSVYILDDHCQPVPIGVPGELYIGGDGLARGYLNQPSMTAEKFLPSPFSNSPDARLYKTGDMARYLPDGNIEFLGRNDYQVKIRGFRIELGEIESVLSQHSAVHEAVVMARQDISGEKRLVAYVVARNSAALNSTMLRAFLKEKLPDYMVPSVFVILDVFPLTPTGKVDRYALPAPDAARPELENSFVAPRTKTEQMLVEIWAEVLGTEQVGVLDNFFDLGGHSLLAVRVIYRIAKRTGLQLNLRDLMFQTLGQLASACEARQPMPHTPPVRFADKVRQVLKPILSRKARQGA